MDFDARLLVILDDLRLEVEDFAGRTATFAAVCVTITPLLLVFLVLNKAIIYGLESGATKG